MRRRRRRNLQAKSVLYLDAVIITLYAESISSASGERALSIVKISVDDADVHHIHQKRKRARLQISTRTPFGSMMEEAQEPCLRRRRLALSILTMSSVGCAARRHCRAPTMAPGGRYGRKR